jgi:hypothetical protein
MMRNEQAESSRDRTELRLRHPIDSSRDDSESSRTIVIRHGSTWQPVAFIVLSLLFVGAILLGHEALRGIDRQNRETAAVMARYERKVQVLEAGMTFDTRRRYLLLSMRDHILKVNPKVSLGEAYRYAQFAVEASEKYPSVDPLLLIAVGTVESGYDPHATSRSDARGLYQIWPATGRLLFRSLGWNFDESALYDPEKNTLAAALYLDILFSTYGDPQLVLAEYNGGPLNAGYFRAGVGALAEETRNYVPRVLQTYTRLKEQVEKGIDLQPALMHRDTQREGKTLAGGGGPSSKRP